MKIVTSLAGLFVVGAASAWLWIGPGDSNRSIAFAGTPAEDAAYKDCVEPPPSSPAPPGFTLSHAYPAVKPTPPVGGYPWEAIDFKTQPGQYINALLAYARADLEPVDWDGSKVPTKWFHAPWMSFGPAKGHGREYFHGMTVERGVTLKELVAGGSISTSFKEVAVGYYNDVGAYTFGQVFAADPAHPDITKSRFENGAMSIKLLFTTATKADVPSLENSLEWDCDLYDGTTQRVPTKVHLLQIDVAVRDARNDALTGWVFGTFEYNAAATGTGVFDRVAPVGLMWGNDPTVVPGTRTIVQSWINPAVGTFQHLGRAGRLNGPVDNKASSCLSCHSTAQMPKPPDMVPPGNLTEQQALAWFQNVKAGDPFLPGGSSLDYSLQMGVAVINAAAWAKAHPTGPATAPAMAMHQMPEVPDQFTRGAESRAGTQQK